MILIELVPEAAYLSRRIGLNPAWNRVLEIEKCSNPLARRAQLVMRPVTQNPS